MPQDMNAQARDAYFAAYCDPQRRTPTNDKKDMGFIAFLREEIKASQSQDHASF